MAFRDRLLTLLRIVTPAGGTALQIRSGPNSNNQGQAVMQLFTGSADEQNPAELTAITDGDLASSNASLFIESPSKVSQSGNGRGYLQLFSRTSGSGSASILGADQTQIQGDSIFLVKQNTTGPNIYLGGTVQGYPAGSAVAVAAGLAVTGDLSVTGKVGFQSTPTVAGDPIIEHGTINVPSVRASGGFWSTTVTFPHSFSSAPAVVASAPSGRLTVTVARITATSCMIGFNNWTAAASVAAPATWIATNA